MSDLVTVTFLAQHGIWNAGEVVAFDAGEAARLAAKGVAAVRGGGATADGDAAAAGAGFEELPAAADLSAAGVPADPTTGTTAAEG